MAVLLQSHADRRSIQGNPDRQNERSHNSYSCICIPAWGIYCKVVDWQYIDYSRYFDYGAVITAILVNDGNEISVMLIITTMLRKAA